MVLIGIPKLIVVAISSALTDASYQDQHTAAASNFHMWVNYNSAAQTFSHVAFKHIYEHTQMDSLFKRSERGNYIKELIGLYLRTGMSDNVIGFEKMTFLFPGPYLYSTVLHSVLSVSHTVDF